ncbi:MAG: hypothetical protein SFY66_10500 [Oculatellaceae cyanobacterium bins.114]|nr:hypothetical protein [Oculatellaceae cyanobacterium bins.114]
MASCWLMRSLTATVLKFTIDKLLQEPQSLLSKGKGKALGGTGALGRERRGDRQEGLCSGLGFGLMPIRNQFGFAIAQFLTQFSSESHLLAEIPVE